jgi:type I restriction enzyme S subunit
MYILQCADGSYYTGSTTNLELRLAQHQAGEGANHTKKRLPVKLVYYEFFDRIQDAFYREKQVQGWSRKKKEALIKGDYELLKRLSRSSPVASASSATGEKNPLPEPFPEPPPLPEPAEGSGNIPVASAGSATGETTSSASGEKNPLPEPAEGSGNIPVASTGTIPVASTGSATGETTSSATGETTSSATGETKSSATGKAASSATGRRRKKPLSEPFPEPPPLPEPAEGSGNNKNPKPMSKNNKNKLVPRLRFPEFQNAGEWEVKRLEEILDYERPDKYIVRDENYTNEGTPVLTANKSFILGYTQETDGICNDIPAIIFDDFTVDKKFADFPFKVKSSAIKILRAKGKDDLKFLFGLMSLIRFEAKEHKRYYLSTYQKLSVPIPKPAEQQKIASCLSSLDEVIAGERQKLELLQQHKKGLLQQLFPQEGETVPRLRFPEFQNAGEWEVKKLEEVFDFQEGFPFSSRDLTDNKENAKQVVRITEINNHNKNAEKVYVPNKKIEELSIEYYKVTKGDLLLSLTGAAGFNFFIWNGEEAYLNQRNVKFIPKDKINKAILFLIEPLIHKKINLMGTGQNNNLSKEALKDVLLLIPKLPEQQKIASCLSSLDDLITAQTQKIELLEQHKKGLVQGLFPMENG